MSVFDRMVMCSAHGGYVDERDAGTFAAGRGIEKHSTCLPCLERSAHEWMKADCPSCTMVAQRIINVLQIYATTNEPFTVSEVPTDAIPAHRRGCPYEHSVVEGQATNDA